MQICRSHACNGHVSRAFSLRQAQFQGSHTTIPVTCCRGTLAMRPLSSHEPCSHSPPPPRNNPNVTLVWHLLPARPHSMCQGNPWRYHATSILSSHPHLLWQCLACPHPHCHSLAMWRLEYPTGMGPPLLHACSLCQSHFKALRLSLLLWQCCSHI